MLTARCARRFQGETARGVNVPEIGSWYRRLSGDTFEIVAVDEQDRTIDVQHFDGTIEELDFDAWAELEVEAVEAPEDWSGSVDVDLEDMPESDVQSNHGWHNPLEFIDSYD